MLKSFGRFDDDGHFFSLSVKFIELIRKINYIQYTSSLLYHFKETKRQTMLRSNNFLRLLNNNSRQNFSF